MHTTLLFLHVLGAGVVVGIVVISFFSALRPLSATMLDRIGYIGKFGMWASAWQLATGIGLYALEPEEFSGSRLFWVKMALFVVEGVLAASLLARKAREAGAQLAKGEKPTNSLAVILTLHALLIVAIVGAGVFLVSGGEN